MNRSFAFVTILLIATAHAFGCGPVRTFDVQQPDATGLDIQQQGCSAPNTMCGDRCVSLQDDLANCGACGHGCPAGQYCTAGHCALQCPVPEAGCSGICTNTMTDRFNCGACGAACSGTQVCSMGRCTFDCAAGLTTCTVGGDAGARDGGTSRYCASLQGDRRNCGSCGHACDLGQACVAGACVVQCPTGQTFCSGACVDITVNPAHCGACGHACPGGQTCVAGACSMTCPTGQMYCTDRCLDVTSDRTNCGACGHTCGDGELCVDGACAFACPADRLNCSMHCVNTNSDRANCGACAHACASGEVCVAGACTVTCATGTTACGGVCSNLTSDGANCGACGTVCPVGQFCIGGACGASCLTGQTICGGACVDTNVDPNNCGYCGGTCGDGYGCLGGYCRPLVGTDASACPPPSRLCGSICTDVRSDNNNCGACGTACAADRTCVTGMCVAPCTAGQIRCGSVCADVHFDRNNCGTCGHACAAGQSCVSSVCVSDPSFRITGLTATGCQTIEASTEIGADLGGIAVSPTQALLSGDMATGLYSAADLTGGVAVRTTHATLTANLQDGSVWVLLTATGTEPAYAWFLPTVATITQLGRIDGATGALTTERITLSSPIQIDGSGGDMIGIFAGYGRLLIHGGNGTAARWSMIRMPSGEVVSLATRAAPAAVNLSFNSFAYYGMAEFFGGEVYAVYVQDSTHIVRYRVSDGTIANIGTWTDLGDMENITFSPSRNRWYFHHTFTSQFRDASGGTFPDQTLGFCNATWDTP